MYKPKSRYQLDTLIHKKVPLETIDTSLITDFSYLFYGKNFDTFKGVENWDLTNVRSVRGMFAHASSYDKDLNLYKWNPKSLKDISYFFWKYKTTNLDEYGDPFLYLSNYKAEEPINWTIAETKLKENYFCYSDNVVRYDFKQKEK